jgi:hypothetical protein
MKHLSIALTYIGFFTLIGVALYVTKNPHVLWALFLISLINSNTENDDK